MLVPPSTLAIFHSRESAGRYLTSSENAYELFWEEHYTVRAAVSSDGVVHAGHFLVYVAMILDVPLIEVRVV